MHMLQPASSTRSGQQRPVVGPMMPAPPQPQPPAAAAAAVAAAPPQPLAFFVQASVHARGKQSPVQ